MKRVLIIDNYDSFTYNLAHILKELGAEVIIKRNDQLTLDEVEPFDYILLSPGPGIPEEAGLLLPIIRTYGATKRILGVCLGEQAIGEVYGGTLVNLDEVYHGVESEVRIVAQDSLFDGLPSTITVGRYHSWVVSSDAFPACLEVTAIDEKTRQIMAIRHREYNVRGIQFHPESVLTPNGKQMILNWLRD